MSKYIIATFLFSVAPALAQVVSYEATSFPEDDGPWEHLTTVFPADRWCRGSSRNFRGRSVRRAERGPRE